MFNIHHMAITFSMAATFSTITYQQKPCLSFLFVFYLSADIMTSRAGLSCVRVNTAKSYWAKKTVARLFYPRPWELLMNFLSLS